MIFVKKHFALLLGTICLSFTWIVFQNWEISPGFSIRFDGKYAHGTFKKLNGTIYFDPANPEIARFDVSVDVNSIDTGIELKNKHARGDKWFDAEQFPLIRFQSSKVTRADSGYLVTGELEMRGIRKELAIPFIFNEEEPGFRGKFKVNRGDFWIGKVNGKESDSTAVEVFVPVLRK